VAARNLKLNLIRLLVVQCAIMLIIWVTISDLIKLTKPSC